jgi:hypothetical protein
VVIDIDDVDDGEDAEEHFEFGDIDCNVGVIAGSCVVDTIKGAIEGNCGAGILTSFRIILGNIV